MKKLIFTSLFIFLAFTIMAQSKLEFQFDQARVLLAKREVSKAMEVLIPLQAELPNDANINFLLGAAYTEEDNQKEGIKYLLKAMQNINLNYVSGDYKEVGAPIHVFYYLTIAYGESNQCVNAREAFEVFKKYKNKINPYYIEEARKYTEKCPAEPEEKGDFLALYNKIEPPKASDTLVDLPLELSEDIMMDSAALARRGVLVQKLKYTTKVPLYGVQIASHNRPAPIGSYSKLKNIDVFIGNDGSIRYVVGHFSYQSQAESLLKKILDLGYAGSFIVNVNDARKYSNELISYNNVNLKAGIKGTVEYYIQLAAVSEELSDKQLDLYFELDGITEIAYDNKTLLVVGPFETYSTSEIQLEEIQSKGYGDAFVVAFNKGKKIDLTLAKRYTDE